MKYKGLTEEDLGNIELGFLPASEHIFSIHHNEFYNAVFKKRGGGKVFIALVGWAHLKNGTCMPLIYCPKSRALRNPEVMENFIEINDEGEEEEEGEEAYD